MDKNAEVHLHNGILLGYKKKKILPFLTAWMNPESIVLSELSKSEKDKYHIISLYVESNEQNEQSRNRLIVQRTGWWLSEGKGFGGLGKKGECIRQKEKKTT